MNLATGEPTASAPRVLHLNSLLTGGGTDDQCVKLASSLPRLGYTVWIAGPEGRRFSAAAREADVTVHHTPREGFLKLRFIFSAAKLIRRRRIRVVHGHHGRDIWPTILAARISGVRPVVVITRHLAKSPSSWFSRRFLLCQCDALVGVSRFVARVLKDGVFEPDSPEPERRARPPLLGDHSKIVVIHGGVDTTRFRPFENREQRGCLGLSEDQYAFAVVGGFDLPRGKGQREFLKAAAAVHRQVPHARFLVIGQGRLRATLEDDISRLGLKGKAWLTGHCADMPGVVNAIDCLVHPQVGTEAFPGVVLEALACGRPVVASSLDGIPEAFDAGEYGQLVKPESVEELARAMESWARQPAADPGFRQALHDRVDELFSVEVMARKYADLYRRLIGLCRSDLANADSAATIGALSRK